MAGKKKKYDVQKATEEEMVSLKPLGSETDVQDDPYLQPVSQGDCKPEAEESAVCCAELASSEGEGYEEPLPQSSKEHNLYEEINEKKPKKDGEAPSPPPPRKETKTKKKSKKKADSSKEKNTKKKAAACKAPTPSKVKKSKKSAATFDPPSSSSEMDLLGKEPAPVMTAPLMAAPQAPAAAQQVSINVSNLMGMTKMSSKPNSNDAAPRQIKKLKSRNKCLNFCNVMVIVACAGLVSLLIVVLRKAEFDVDPDSPSTDKPEVFPKNATVERTFCTQRNLTTPENATVDNMCPGGFLANRDDTSCYNGSTSGYSWDGCWEYCAKEKAILVEIDDEEKLQALEDTLFDQQNATYWTGGRKLGGKNFIWIWDHSRAHIGSNSSVWRHSAATSTNATRVSVDLKTGLNASEASEEFHCICEIRCSA